VYEGPITRGQDKHASAREREVGAAVAAELRRVIQPYFLRREKADVLGGGGASRSGAGPGAAGESDAGAAGEPGSSCSSALGASDSSKAGQPPQPQALGRKNDLVVWLQLVPLQRAV
jgi:hypothetical protein